MEKRARNPVFSPLRDLAGGHHESRPGAEGCVGIGGIAVFGWRLSPDDSLWHRVNQTPETL